MKARSSAANSASSASLVPLTIRNAFSLLASDTRQDDTAGIRIASVLDDPACSYYITEIAPGRSVNPHYHRQGDEIYIILGGVGTIHTWHPEAPAQVDSQPIGSGALFRIPPGTAHQLENTGADPLILLFACSPDHLGSDRFVVPPAPAREEVSA